jgi:hypothetical protein
MSLLQFKYHKHPLGHSNDNNYLVPILQDMGGSQPENFVVKSGRNSGTGAGIPEIPAETAGVNTAVRNQILFCAFFARFLKPGRQQQKPGCQNLVRSSQMWVFWQN